MYYLNYKAHIFFGGTNVVNADMCVLFNTNSYLKITTIMKQHLKRASLLFAGILIGGKLLAQSGDSTHVASDYVTPFAGKQCLSYLVNRC